VSGEKLADRRSNGHPPPTPDHSSPVTARRPPVAAFRSMNEAPYRDHVRTRSREAHEGWMLVIVVISWCRAVDTHMEIR
jgi:hypothetical protein